MKALKYLLHIGGEVQRVGDDDAIERFLELEQFSGLDVKLRLGEPYTGSRNLNG